MKYDLVVIGGGLAGLTAAIRSLLMGNKTCVISAGASTLSYMSGCLDLCGDGDHPWQEIEQLVQREPGHPYSYLTGQEIRAALDFFVSEMAVSCPYRTPPDFRRNLWVPTPLGNLRPTYLVPEGQAAGAESLSLKVLVVDLQGCRDFSAAFMAEGLSRRGLQWQAVEVELGSVQKNSSSVELAHSLDHLWPELVPQLKPEVQGFDAVAFPAVLGLSDYLLIQQELETALGIPVFEIPTLPPSVPGIRLDQSLKARLRELGGELLFGFPVQELKVEGGSCRGVEVSTPGQPRLIEGESFILATGSMGQGLGCLGKGASRAAGVSFFDPEGPGYAKSGVLVNERLQPVDAGGKVLLENVFCAGRVLAGYDPFREHNGAGVAIATGCKAALNLR
jgi:glycerol-3-phosphate dehydrogenase subunit B